MADQVPIKANVVSGTAMSLAQFDPTDSVGIVQGGTGATNQQAAINNVSGVNGATIGYVLTKDSFGNATYQPSAGGGGGTVTSVSGRTGVVVLTSADVGLAAVNNTSDATKPVSTAQAASIATKQATLVSGVNIKTVNGNSLLGSGDLGISGGSSYEIYVASFAGADPSGGTSSSTAFSSAASAAGTSGQVRVTKGIWNLGSNTPYCNWCVDPGVTFTGAGSLVGHVSYNSKFDNFPGTPVQGAYFGRSSDPMVGVGNYNNVPAALRGVSPVACTGLLGVSQSSDSTTVGAMGCIGVTAFSNNNNTTTPQYSYGMYIEAIRQNTAGSALGLEIDVTNRGNTEQITPNGWAFRTDFPSVMNVTAMIWLASGGGFAVNDVSCAMAIIPNGAKSAKGIVFVNGALSSDSAPVGGIEYDAMSMPMQYALNWWDTGNIKRLSIRGEFNSTIGANTLVFDGPINFVSQTTTTSASAGPYAVPSTCSGFLYVGIGGTQVKIPFFG